MMSVYLLICVQVHITHPFHSKARKNGGGKNTMEDNKKPVGKLYFYRPSECENVWGRNAMRVSV